MDHLAGPVTVHGEARTIEVFSDPLDPALTRAEREGRLIWGWSEPDLARWNQALEVRRDHTVPFSVASDRLEAIARGVDVTITVVHHPEAEDAVRRVREDLRLLRASLPDRTNRHVERGLSVAWHHLTTLTSLPCTPRRFDRFCGLPPWAARATSTFEPELSAWARPSRATSASTPPSSPATSGTSEPPSTAATHSRRRSSRRSGRRTETLVVTRTRTASRALLDALGADPDAGRDREPHCLPHRTAAPRGDLAARPS